ncbi:MAG: histidine phosphatase family protein [Clostridia bacterium]|nr:histidine phosphatase family protein [Clostridia bacterium]
MDLYMIRHGESLANFTGTHAGWAPVPLTEKGEAQAEAARRHVQNLTFDHLYVSDVRRAQQTADILFPGVPRTFNTIIREINNTSMRGKTCDDMTALYGERYLACRKNFDYAPLGIDCESGAHMLARAQEFLDLVAADETLTRVAAVAHAGFITAMAEVVLGARVGRQMSCGNASISIFRYENTRWRLRLWNLTPDMD